MAKARKDHPKPRSRRSIRRVAEMVKINNEKIAKFVEEYVTRDSQHDTSRLEPRV